VKVENCRERGSEKEWTEKQESIINIWLFITNEIKRDFQQSP